MGELVPLDQRIADVLSEPCTAAQAGEVLALVGEALVGMRAEVAAADATRLDPLTPAVEAARAHEGIASARFDVERLEAQQDALTARQRQLQDAEREAVAVAERTAALDERTALVGDIQRDYPAIVRQLSQLVVRIQASDARCARAGIPESAESIAREIGANFYHRGAPALRLIDVRLPMPTGGRLAWDRASLTDIAPTFFALSEPEGIAA